ASIHLRVYNGVPIDVRQNEEQVVADAARAANEHVQPAELADCARDHAIDLLSVGDIAGDGKTLDRPGDLLRFVEVHVGDDHLGPIPREPLGGRRPDAPAAARDEDDFVLEGHFVAVSNAAPPSFLGSDAPDRKPSRSATITWGWARCDSELRVARATV